MNFKALIEESEIRKFPDNDLLRHLRLVTQDAEKCASVAQQLLNGKRQTRYVCVGSFTFLWCLFGNTICVTVIVGTETCLCAYLLCSFLSK